MEELANLEREWGNPSYQSDGRNAEESRKTDKNGHENSKMLSNAAVSAAGNHGKRERVASREMCTFLILNISSLQLISVNIIAYRQ